MRVTHITPNDNSVNQNDWAADHVIVTDTGWGNPAARHGFIAS